MIHDIYSLGGEANYKKKKKKKAQSSQMPREKVEMIIHKHQNHDVQHNA